MKTKKGGFTIVETSLVLAIAGLIFLMVFVALPALLRLQRDTQRRDDVTTMLSKLKKYQSNNRGALPSGTTDGIGWDESRVAVQGTWEDFYASYLNDSDAEENQFIDPNGTEYKLMVHGCNESESKNIITSVADRECATTTNGGVAQVPTTMDYKIHVIVGAVCSGEKVVGSKSMRKVAALYRLESGGIACSNT